ncbi:hypothetical protein [Glaciibacter sp. 2TAF33]|uniref:hypothetical protein n=1 Tax=Glaciibacter sp. 2TAF33 TaxID=3233015 RepID=UPI003F9377EB
MTDPTLRLPATTFRAVLNLGVTPIGGAALPARFQNPDLDVELHDEPGDEFAAFYLEFPDGKLHAEVSADQLEYHYHDADDEFSEASPWPADDTAALLDWTTRLIAHVLPRLPDLLVDIDEAAEWCDLGLPVYARDYDPVPLEIIEVEVEGDLLMLPWLGAGYVDHAHLDGADEPIALLWNPEHELADRPIAKAWLDGETGHPASAAEPGTDWAAVGLPEAEVLAWFEGFYLNHQVIADPADLIRSAALKRIGGLDR